MKCPVREKGVTAWNNEVAVQGRSATQEISCESRVAIQDIRILKYITQAFQHYCKTKMYRPAVIALRWRNGEKGGRNLKKISTK